MSKPKYDSTVARMAGNIASGRWSGFAHEVDYVARMSVVLARAIVAEVQRTEPAVVPDECGNRVNGTRVRCYLALGHTGNCAAVSEVGK